MTPANLQAQKFRDGVGGQQQRGADGHEHRPQPRRDFIRADRLVPSI